GKRRHHAAATEHKPCFIAVPHRRDAIHDDVSISLRGKQRKKDAETEVEAGHHDINKHSKRDDECPDRREVEGYAHTPAPSTATPAAGVMPAARTGISLRGPS